MKRLALVVCLVASYAFGQGGAVTAVPTITNTRGEPVPYAQVAVCSQNPGSLPSTVCNGSFATLYTDITISVACQTDVTPIAPISGTGCTNPGKSDGLGNVVAFAPAGQYWCEYSGGSITRPIVVPCFFSSGGGAANLNCPAALNGSLGAFTSTTTFSCDPNMGTDFAGNGFSQSWKYLGPVNGFFGVIGGTSDPGTQAKFKLNTNEVRLLAPLTVPTPYYLRLPSTNGVVGQLPYLNAQANDPNGDPVDKLDWLNASISINSTSCPVGGSCSISTGAGSVTSISQGLGIANTPNPIVATGSVALDGASQIGTPTAPTLTVNGVTGATTYTYLVVACENPPVGTADCTRSTAASGTTSVANGNATLSSSNSITLSGYGDTLYGPRCYEIFRTVGGATQGPIALCAGKVFTDTGLPALNGSTAPVTNNTLLLLNMAALPGCNIPAGGLIGPDAPPCSPTVYDDEMQETSGAPGDVNNTVWSKNANYGSTAATWTSGAISFIPQSGAAFFEYLIHSTALPTAPYTFRVYVDNVVFGNTSEGDECFIGLRESGTGKIATTAIYRRGAVNDISANGGFMLLAQNAPSDTFTSGSQAFEAYDFGGAWLQIQVTGGNVVRSYSTNGVVFTTINSQALTTAFTTAPDQLIIGGSGAGGGSPACMFDWERRTQ